MVGLRAWLGLWAAWWARRPSVQRSDMTSPAAVERGREIPALKVPGRVQVLWLKLPRAPHSALEDLLSEMEAIERGYPEGGGTVVLKATRAKDGQREWRWCRTQAEPPERVITQLRVG